MTLLLYLYLERIIESENHEKSKNHVAHNLRDDFVLSCVLSHLPLLFVWGFLRSFFGLSADCEVLSSNWENVHLWASIYCLESESCIALMYFLNYFGNKT